VSGSRKHCRQKWGWPRTGPWPGWTTRQKANAGFWERDCKRKEADDRILGGDHKLNCASRGRSSRKGGSPRTRLGGHRNKKASPVASLEEKHFLIVGTQSQSEEETPRKGRNTLRGGSPKLAQKSSGRAKIDRPEGLHPLGEPFSGKNFLGPVRKESSIWRRFFLILPTATGRSVALYRGSEQSTDHPKVPYCRGRERTTVRG